MCKEMDRIYGMGEEQGRAMEQKNTERERRRADRLEKRNILLEQKLAELGVTISV